nr:hypothetical protein [Tanacetum cinerariifolium]
GGRSPTAPGELISQGETRPACGRRRARAGWGNGAVGGGARRAGPALVGRE